MKHSARAHCRCGVLRCHARVRAAPGAERVSRTCHGGIYGLRTFVLTPFSKPQSFGFAKELIAGFAGAEVDKLIETKGEYAVPSVR